MAGLLGGWGTAVTFFLSFRAWLTKILHCQHANPELNHHTEHGDDKHVLNTTRTKKQHNDLYSRYWELWGEQ